MIFSGSGFQDDVSAIPDMLIDWSPSPGMACFRAEHACVSSVYDEYWWKFPILEHQMQVILTRR